MLSLRSHHFFSGGFAHHFRQCLASDGVLRCQKPIDDTLSTWLHFWSRTGQWPDLLWRRREELFSKTCLVHRAADMWSHNKSARCLFDLNEWRQRYLGIWLVLSNQVWMVRTSEREKKIHPSSSMSPRMKEWLRRNNHRVKVFWRILTVRSCQDNKQSLNSTGQASELVGIRPYSIAAYRLDYCPRETYFRQRTNQEGDSLPTSTARRGRTKSNLLGFVRDVSRSIASCWVPLGDDDDRAREFTRRIFYRLLFIDATNIRYKKNQTESFGCI